MAQPGPREVSALPEACPACRRRSDGRASPQGSDAPCPSPVTRAIGRDLLSEGSTDGLGELMEAEKRPCWRGEDEAPTLNTPSGAAALSRQERDVKRSTSSERGSSKASQGGRSAF